MFDTARVLALPLVLTALAFPAGAVAAPKPQDRESVRTLAGVDAPATPDEFNRVRILKQGDPKAENVLVLVPGTSGGAAYFRPFASSFVKRMPEYQVWSVERRENLLEDHSVFDAELRGEATVQEMFDYYLGWLGDPSVSPRFDPVTTSEAPFVREWGMRVAVGDLRKVVRAARRGGRTVVMGGHSLGGSIMTAYATWDFNGRAGAEDLAGLVYIDGGSLGSDPPTAEEATTSLENLSTSSPFLDLLGAGLPWVAGIFNEVGASAALDAPFEPSVAQAFPLLPASLKPPVPANNRAQYGYGFDSETSPASLALIHVHIGSLAAAGDPRDWDNGELGTVERTADAFRGIEGMDGTAWYHPRRLSIDSGGVNNGVGNPAQAVFGLRATHGDDVDLPIYAFETSLGYANGASRVVAAARQLAEQSGVGAKDLKLVSKPSKYAHIDPLTASPGKNAFLKTVVPFLRRRVAP